MKQHKLSAAFPAMTPAEFAALVEDIRANGQRNPIIVFEGCVLDGWHRLRACIEADREPAFADYPGQDPAGYVLSTNLHRRHLSASQRAGAIVACNEWRSNGERTQLRNVAELSQTAKQMAEVAQVSTRTIESAKVAQSAGFGDDVRDGKISVNAAAAKAKAPEPKPADQKARRELPTIPAPDLSAQLDAMHAQLTDMQAELIELRAASHDEQLRRQAHDEIQGLREALELEQQLHEALKAQRETMEYQLNGWKNRCVSLEKQLARRERGE